MSTSASPQIPTYRVTLFYGPEFIEHGTPEVQCVFNVKKRSWKGGVQISVSVLKSQLHCLINDLQFEDWLHAVLQGIPLEERSDYSQRAHDLLAQQLCYVKLMLTLAHGVQQEHGQVTSRQFLEELNHEVHAREEWIKNQIINELDVECPADNPSLGSDADQQP